MKKSCISITILKPIYTRSLQPHCIFFFQLAIELNPGIFQWPNRLWRSWLKLQPLQVLLQVCNSSAHITKLNPIQESNLLRQLSTHLLSTNSDLATKPSLHAAWMTSSYYGSFNHIDSKQKAFPILRLWDLEVKPKAKEEWLETAEDKWNSLAEGNNET